MGVAAQWLFSNIVNVAACIMAVQCLQVPALHNNSRAFRIKTVHWQLLCVCRHAVEQLEIFTSAVCCGGLVEAQHVLR